MKILFAVVLIASLMAAAVFAVLAVRGRAKQQVLRAVICCCMAALSALGFVMSAPGAGEAAVSAVHVTVSPVWRTPAPSDTASPAQAQGAYTASRASDKFHSPSCSSVSRISDDNRLWFSTREEAAAAGYAPCGICRP